MNFYEQYFIRYMCASDDMRRECKAHWEKCHSANVASGREDLIIWSGKILSMIALADSDKAQETLEAILEREAVRKIAK